MLLEADQDAVLDLSMTVIDDMMLQLYDEAPEAIAQLTKEDIEEDKKAREEEERIYKEEKALQDQADREQEE